MRATMTACQNGKKWQPIRHILLVEYHRQGIHIAG
jgi:hypothetical protein